MMKTVDPLPVTISSEYKDISLLLLALTHGLTDVSPFYFTAMSAFALLHSAFSSEVKPMLPFLKRHILTVTSQSEIIIEETEALGYTAYVLTNQNKWDHDLQAHQENLVSYFEAVKRLQWLRNPSVAALFILGFSTLQPFCHLNRDAKNYLNLELPRASNSNLPVIAFGLSIGGETPSLNDEQIKGWLSQTHRSFKGICMLAMTLSAMHHALSQQFVTNFQQEASKIYSGIISQNISTIRVLLAVIHMAEMGQNAEQITQSLRRLPIDESIRDRVSAVIRADSQLFIEFQDNQLTQNPTLDFITFYLFSANKLGLTKAYIIDNRLKTDFLTFAEEWGGQSKAIHHVTLAILIMISLAASITVLVQIWWPLSNKLYEWSMKIWQDQPLITSYLDDLLKGIILLPVYLIIGAALGMWLHGRVKGNDIKPENIVANARTITEQLSKWNVRGKSE